MAWKYLFNCVFLMSLLSHQVWAEEEEEMCDCIFMQIMDKAGTCDGWEDAAIKNELEMILEEGVDGAPDLVYLSGTSDVGVEVKDGFQIGIAVNLITPNGEDLVWSGSASVCQSMQDEDAPWFPLLAPFNTTECPIPANVYPVPKMSLNLDFAKGCLTEDFVGSYGILITMENAMDKIMCMKLGAEIMQEERPCKFCPGKD